MSSSSSSSMENELTKATHYVGVSGLEIPVEGLNDAYRRLQQTPNRTARSTHQQDTNTNESSGDMRNDDDEEEAEGLEEEDDDDDEERWVSGADQPHEKLKGLKDSVDSVDGGDNEEDIEEDSGEVYYEDETMRDDNRGGRGEEDSFPEVNVTEESDYMDQLPEEERYFPVGTPTTEVEEEPGPLTSPFSPSARRSQQKRRRFHFGEQENVEWSLMPCRKVSVVVRVKPPLLKFGGPDDSTMYVLTDADVQALSYGTPGKGFPSQNMTTMRDRQPATPLQSSLRTPAVCLFPLLAADDRAEKVEDPSEYPARTQDMIVVNPSSFGDYIPTEVTMETARMVAQVAQITSEDWARHYRFDDVLWPDGFGAADAGADAGWHDVPSSAALVDAASAAADDAVRRDINSAFFTMGARDSGGSYTLFGSSCISTPVNSSESPSETFHRTGLVGVVAASLLDLLEKYHEDGQESGGLVTMSMIEIVDEDDLRDCLRWGGNAPDGREGKEVPLRIRHPDHHGAIVQDVLEVAVDSLDYVEELLLSSFESVAVREARKKEGGRGHIIVTLKVHLTSQSDNGKEIMSDYHNTIQLVDLAPTDMDEGPVENKRTSSVYKEIASGTEKLYERRVASIRKSLSGLRGILRTLIIREVQGKAHQSLTYRECTLTKLLQRTLDTPSSRAVLVATVCSRREAYERTLSTLNYIHRLLVRKGLTARSPFGAAADSKRLHHGLNAAAIKQHFANDENALYKMMLADPRQRLAGYLAAASAVPGDDATPVAPRPPVEPQPSPDASIPSPGHEQYDAVIAKLDALHKTPEPRYRPDDDPDADDGEDDDYRPPPSNPSDHPEEVLVPGGHDPTPQELVAAPAETPRHVAPCDPAGEEPTPSSLATPQDISPSHHQERPLLLDGPEQLAAVDPPADDVLPIVPRKEAEEWRQLPAPSRAPDPQPQSLVPVLAPKVPPPSPLPKPKPPRRMDSDSTTDTDNTSTYRTRGILPNPFGRLRALGSYPVRTQRAKDITEPQQQMEGVPTGENGPAMTTRLDYSDGPNDESIGRDGAVEDSGPSMRPGHSEEPEGNEPYHQGRLPPVGEEVPSPAPPPPSPARHTVSSTTERSYVEKHYTTTSRASKKDSGLAAFLSREGDRSRNRKRESGGSHTSSKEEYDRPSDGDSRDNPQRDRDMAAILSTLESLQGDLHAFMDPGAGSPDGPSNLASERQDPSATPQAPSSSRGLRDSPSDYGRELRYARSPVSGGSHAASPPSQDNEDDGRDRPSNAFRKVSFAPPSTDASPRNSDSDTLTQTQTRYETQETTPDADNGRESDSRVKFSRYTDSDGRTVRLPSRLGRMVDELVSAKQILEDDLVSRMQKESEREALKKELERLRQQVSQARRSKDNLERDLRSLSQASADEVARLQERLKRLREEHKVATKEQLHQKNLETENLLLQNEVENITRDLNEALKSKEEMERRQREGFKESLDLKRSFETERRTLKETIDELREKSDGRDTESFLRDLKRMDEENRIEHTARRKAEDRLLDMEAQKERAEQRVEELQELMEAMDDENKSTVEDLTARQTASDELLNSQLREILDLLKVLRPNLDRRFYDDVFSKETTKDARSTIIRKIKEEVREVIANKKDQAVERAQTQAQLEAENDELRKEVDKLRRELDTLGREQVEVLQEVERLREHAAEMGDAPSTDHSELLKVLTTSLQEPRIPSDSMREQMQWLKESTRLSLERIKDDYQDALRATRDGAMAQAEDELKELRNRLEDEIEARKKAVDQLKEMERQMRRFADSRQAEINKLGEEHDAVVRSSLKQIGELTSRVNELEKEKAALEEDFAVAGKELEQAITEKKELESEMQRLKQKLRDAEQNATEAARRNDVLQEAVDELRRSHDAEVEALRQDLISVQNAHEKLRKTHITEMERLESALVDSEAQRDGLHKELEAKTAQLERLAAKGRNDLSTLEKKFKEKLAHMERTQNDLLAEKGRQLDELRDKNAALARELGATKDALTKARVDKMNTDNNESRLRSLIKELEEKLKESDGKAQQSERSLAQSEGDAGKLRRELSDRDERHSTVVKDLDDELQRLRDVVASRDGEVESLEDKLRDVSRELAECQKAIEDGDRAKESMSREMQELVELRESNERLRETIEELNRNYSVLQDQSELALKRASEENERKERQLQDASAAKANIYKEQISSLLRERDNAEEALKTLRDLLEKETDGKKELERDMDELRDSVERYHRSMEEMKKDVLSIQKKANESVSVVKRKWKQAETRHETALDDVRLWATTTISGLTSQLRVANETIRRLGSKRVREQPVHTDENGMPIQQLEDGRNGTEYTEEETIRVTEEEETRREESGELRRHSDDGDDASDALARERTLRKEAEEVAVAIAARAKSCFEEKNAEIAELKTQLSTMQEEHNTEIAGLLTALSSARRYRDFVRERASAARTQLQDEGGEDQAADAFKEIELCDPPLDVQWPSDRNTSIIEHEVEQGTGK